MFECKPDFDAVLDRYEAWWDAQIIDRPLVSMTFPRPQRNQIPPPAPRHHATLRDRWLDTQWVVEQACSRMANTCFHADALPVTYPNLGPEIFSALYGCPLEFGETTSWSLPILHDWGQAALDQLQLDLTGPYGAKLTEMTDALIEAGRGRFIVGYTDLHGGGDAVAAFRDPQQLCLDMIEHPAEVRSLVERITTDFLQVYDFYHRRLSAAGMPSTTWLPATCRGKFHVPSNDFSCMITDRMFQDIFLPGIVRECEPMDRCIYHLDGPQALRYLDILLDLPQIHAIQWVPGAGRDHWRQWVPVYRRIQQRGKSFCLNVSVRELPEVFQALRPEGAWLLVSGVSDQESAAAALDRIARWSP